ncbi:MAG: Hpt domain-containing protein [Methylobacter sp.]
MLLTTKRHEQFIVLMAGNFDVSHSLLKYPSQNIIAATQYDDILTQIKTTQFDLILLDLTINCTPDRLNHFPRQTELISLIKDPSGINSKTPVIAMINPVKNSQSGQRDLSAFDDNLTFPLTEQQLNEVIDHWQAKALAQDYIEIILGKTKNNQRLTLTLFEKLFEELPLQIIEIKNALENRQYDCAQEITHKLNGSVSFCGLIDIQQPANALESCLLTHHYTSIDQHFLMLQQRTLNFTRHQQLILANLRKC